MVGIFIETSKDRNNELICNKTFSDFVADEVMPWALEHYNITEEPSKNVIAGFSLGGLTASFLGLTHSDIFGNVFLNLVLIGGLLKMMVILIGRLDSMKLMKNCH